MGGLERVPWAVWAETDATVPCLWCRQPDLAEVGELVGDAIVTPDGCSHHAAETRIIACEDCHRLIAVTLRWHRGGFEWWLQPAFGLADLAYMDHFQWSPPGIDRAVLAAAP